MKLRSDWWIYERAGDALPGNGERGLKLINQLESPLALVDALPGNGERGLKHKERLAVDFNLFDALPGNGERGLKRFVITRLVNIPATRSPATGSED